MADKTSDDSSSWQTTAGEQFSNLKEKMIAATGYTGKKVKEVSQATSRELDKAIARWTPLPLSPEEIDRLTNLRESLPRAPEVPSLEDLVESMGNVMIPIDEYEKLLQSFAANEEIRKEQEGMLIESLAITQKLLETENSLEKLKILTSDLKSRKDKKPVQEQGLRESLGTSLSEIVMLLGFSVIWLSLLIGSTLYIESMNLVVGDYSADLFIWSIGTMIWSLVLLQRLEAFRTILAMPLGMRIQTSIGIGLVTAMALLLTKEEFAAIGNVWGWTSTIALSALLLSGFIRGLFNSSKYLIKFNKIKEIETVAKK
ncbi:MAG: hypothetical protein DWB93_03655 [Candidatus Poseidoniales archaeon]|nr:MAG: hypothetical protein DWB93_03655 [Candidatus Poseidoniales archaeon]